MVREITVVGFFVHTLLINYGTSAAIKSIKRELTNIFIRQVAKSLIFKPQSDSAWGVSASLL